MLISRPVAASETSRLERPYEMNGRVTPVAGSRARLTPIWRMAARLISATRPVARNCPNGSGAVRAMRNPAQMNAPNSAVIAKTPMKPHSSPIVEKMKSE